MKLDFDTVTYIKHETSRIYLNNPNSVSDKHFLEIGAGITILNRLKNSDNHNETIAILALRAGFRYQRPNGGFFFKAGFTPLYNFYVDHPLPNTNYFSWFFLPGIAFGYTF